MDSLNDKFGRQRKIVMVMSLIVIIQDFIGLKYEEINILGNKASISEPSSVKWLLFFLLLYWFARYVQMFVEIKDRGIKKDYKYLYSKSLQSSSWYKNTLHEARNRKVLYLGGERSANFQRSEIFLIGFFRSRVVNSYLSPLDDGGPFDRIDTPIFTGTKAALRACISMVFFNFRFTEYILPFILFFSAFFIWILANVNLILFWI